MSRAWIMAVMLAVLSPIGCGGSGDGGGDGEDTCPPGTTLEVHPATITVAAGSPGFDAVGGLSNCPAMVQWALSGPGSLSATEGIPVHYTPPATVSSTVTATLTASAAGLVDTIVVTILPASAIPLDPGFARTWTGPLSMNCAGVGTTVYPGGTLPITVSGYELMTRLACPDGTRLDVIATGSGSTATWTGTFSCPPTAMGTCSSWVFTRTSVTFTLNGNGTLTAAGVGTLVGCGTSTSCTTSFPGT